MERSKIFVSLMMGLFLLLISNNAFAVKTPLVFPEENALFYAGESHEQSMSAQGWASITKGTDSKVEVAITASGLFDDCKYGVRVTDPSTGRKEDLGFIYVDQEEKGIFRLDVASDYLTDWKMIEVYGIASCSGGKDGRILSFNLENPGERG